MPFLTGTIKLNFYTDGSDTEFPVVNVPSIVRDFKSTTAAEVQTVVISLAPSASQTINLNGVDTVDGLYVYSSVNPVGVNINGSGDIIFNGVRPGYIPASVTSLVVTNQSASTATVVEIVLIKE